MGLFIHNKLSLSFRFFLLLLIISVKVYCQETNYTLTGEYQGKNLYVQNPLSKDKINFCTSAVYLNEQLVNTAPKTSAFAIDLSGLEIGDPVYIKIVHKDGCKPKIINPQVIRSKSMFQFLNVQADALSVHWTTSGELPYGKFFLEHFRNKKWEIIETISGKGSFEVNQYDIKPEHHTGENRYRIKYIQNNNKIFFSTIFEFFNDVDPISFYPTMVVDKITLSRTSDYEVIDSFGNQITKGKGKEIDLDNLKAGLYFLYVDNREERFVKK